jgi:hypothetical protein
MNTVRDVVAADPALVLDLALLCTINGFGEISVAILLAELPDSAGFTPSSDRRRMIRCSKDRRPAGRRGGLAALVGLSPSGQSSGSSVRRPGKSSHVGNDRLPATFYMCALSAARINRALLGFVQRLKHAGKPPNVILVAVARKLLGQAHVTVPPSNAVHILPRCPLSGLTPLRRGGPTTARSVATAGSAIARSTRTAEPSTNPPHVRSDGGNLRAAPLASPAPAGRPSYGRSQSPAPAACLQTSGACQAAATKFG